MAGDQAGDTIALHLDVVPDGGNPVDVTTTATVEAILDGAVRYPAAFPDLEQGRGRWSALLTDVDAGLYTIRWTVTGTGAGVTVYTLPVAPNAYRQAGARTYATTGELAAHLGGAPPDDAHRLLARASELVDELLRCAEYPVDELGLPTDPAHAAALSAATCAQVSWWDEIGDDTGSGAVAALAGAQIGSVRLPGAGASSSSSDTGGGRYAPAAVLALRAAGLTWQGPSTPGGWRS